MSHPATAAHLPTNAGYSAASATRLPVSHVFLDQPVSEWTYAHHPHLAYFAGRFYAAWSNGRQHEDDCDQRVRYCHSADGRTWSRPQTLYAEPGAVLTAAGFHVHAGQLVAYVGRYRYRREALADGRRPVGDCDHLETGLWARTTGDGVTWSAPQALGLPIVPNHGPQRTASGRLIIAGNIAYPYTDAPDGLRGWTMAGLYPPMPAAAVVDDSAGFYAVQHHHGWSAALCEGAWYQTDDRALHLLLRSGTPWLWYSRSTDDGATWAPPVPAPFSDNTTKFHLGRLPDGRFYYVGCPDAEPQWRRSPLVLSLSDDGQHFDRHYILADETTPYVQRAAGLHKGGDYGYPHTLVHDGTLLVIVSRRKEAVEVLQIPLPPA